MIHLLRSGVLALCLAGLGYSAELKGILIDKHCSYNAETRVVPGPRLEGGIIVAYVHSRQCLLKPDCLKSGLGVFTYDQKFVAFDSAGSRKALALLKSSKKEDYLKVDVTGEVQNDTIRVATLKFVE